MKIYNPFRWHVTKFEDAFVVRSLHPIIGFQYLDKRNSDNFAWSEDSPEWFMFSTKLEACKRLHYLRTRKKEVSNPRKEVLTYGEAKHEINKAKVLGDSHEQ